MVDEGTGSEVYGLERFFFLSFRGIDFLALAASLWRRPGPVAGLSGSLPKSGVTFPLTFLRNSPEKYPSVLLAKFIVQS